MVAVIFLGPRTGRFNERGKAVNIPGHSIPVTLQRLSVAFLMSAALVRRPTLSHAFARDVWPNWPRRRRTSIPGRFERRLASAAGRCFARGSTGSALYATCSTAANWPAGSSLVAHHSRRNTADVWIFRVQRWLAIFHNEVRRRGGCGTFRRQHDHLRQLGRHYGYALQAHLVHCQEVGMLLRKQCSHAWQASLPCACCVPSHLPRRVPSLMSQLKKN